MLPDIESKDWSTAVTFESGIETDNKRFYLAPVFHFESAYSKVVAVGLQFEAGLRVYPWLNLMAQHHSRHAADRENGSGSVTRYPLYDTIGVRIKFVQ